MVELRTSQTQLFLIRGVVAIVWAAVFATASGSLTTGAKVLLVLYPVIDMVASAIDARGQRGSARHLLELDALISAAAAVAMGIAATGDIADVLWVFGVWAALTGAAQLVVAIRRRMIFGTQWPMLIAGGLSTVAGISFAVTATGNDPKVGPLAAYAAAGGVFFVIQAGLLARRLHRVTVAS
jgi:uncharacterized membrane protein HdeD (DUF308 family)